MSGSALLGQPPLSADDKLIMKGIQLTTPSLLKAIPLVAKQGNHDSRATSMIIGEVFAIALAIIITIARLTVRWSKLHTLGADDLMIIPACLCCVVYLSLNLASETAGCLGRHIYTCTYEEFERFYYFAHVNYPLFYITVFSAKISIVLLNRRITGMTSKKWQYAHWTYLALLICLLPICVCLNAFQCQPVAAEYSFKAVAQVADPRTIKCLNGDKIGLATRCLHIITDWLLIPVPLIIIWRTQMKLSKKLRLMSVFAVGVVSSIASIMRNVLVVAPTPDVTYDYYFIYAWDVVDILFATIVASLPALNGLIDWSATKVWTWGSHSNSLLRGKFSILGGSSKQSYSSRQGPFSSEGETLPPGKNEIVKFDPFDVSLHAIPVYPPRGYEPATQPLGTFRERQEFGK